MMTLAFVLVLIAGSQAHSQQTINYELHANIIYRFTKYIDWPKEKKSGDFIIGIVGDSPLYDELTKFVDNKTVGEQKIKVKRFSASADAFTSHILFIGEEESGSVKRIAGITANTSTLLVSESEGLARKGSCINMVIANEHLKLEINKTNIEKRNLNIATELLQLGVIIK